MRSHRKIILVEVGIVSLVATLMGLIIRGDMRDRLDETIRPLVGVVETLGRRVTSLEVVSADYIVLQTIEQHLFDGGKTFMTSEQISSCASVIFRYHKRYGTHGEDPLGMDYDLILAWIKVESNFDPKAVSSAGAIGLTQQMPVTAQDGLVRYMGEQVLSKDEVKKKALDPEINLILGLERLVEYQKTFMARGHASVSDWKLTLSLYNWSVQAVNSLINSHKGDTPKASLKYALDVEGARKEFRNV